jgi:hypothetical protein
VRSSTDSKVIQLNLDTEHELKRAELFFSEQDCIRRHFRTLADLKTFGILSHRSKVAIAGVL